MSTRRFLTAIVVAILVVLLAAPVRLHAQTDPASAIKAETDAMNAGDVDAAVAMFAEDAVFRVTPPPSGTTGVFAGKQQLRAWFQQEVAEHIHLMVGGLEVAGERVTWTATLELDTFRMLGVGPVAQRGEAVVREGKIVSMTVANQFTPAQAAKLRGAGTPKAMPRTGGGSFPAYAWWLALVGLGSAGAGWALRHRRSART